MMTAYSQQSTANLLAEHESDIQFIRKMNGCGQSLLVRDSLNRLWVTKLKSNLQGPHSLANELLGSFLCNAMGLPVPEAKALHISETFFNDQRTWFRTAIGFERPTGGLHFASRFFPDMSGSLTADFLRPTLRSTFIDHSACLGMFIFDVWALHVDSRQALFYAERGCSRVVFIDHGHLFGGPNWAETDYRPGGRMLEKLAIEIYDNPREVEEWIAKMEHVIPQSFEEAINEIPVTWYTSDIKRLHEVFIKRLGILRLLVASAVEATRLKIEVLLESEQRLSNSSIRVLSKRGADLWM